MFLLFSDGNLHNCQRGKARTIGARLRTQKLGFNLLFDHFIYELFLHGYVESILSEKISVQLTSLSSTYCLQDLVNNAPDWATPQHQRCAQQKHVFSTDDRRGIWSDLFHFAGHPSCYIFVRFMVPVYRP